jgi:hypothetical protein
MAEMVQLKGDNPPAVRMSAGVVGVAIATDFSDTNAVQDRHKKCEIGRLEIYAAGS